MKMDETHGMPLLVDQAQLQVCPPPGIAILHHMCVDLEPPDNTPPPATSLSFSLPVVASRLRFDRRRVHHRHQASDPVRRGLWPHLNESVLNRRRVIDEGF